MSRDLRYLPGMFNPLFPLSDLPANSMKARDGVLVVRDDAGDLHALDNACPHQGYPLAQGQLCGQLLTCCWHNFKFDVASGACVMGEESVRKHEVRVVDGMVEVNRKVGVDTAAAWSSLAQAMARHQGSRIAREVARLLTAGIRPQEILGWGAMWDADRGEYGPGHAMASAATLCGWLEEAPGGGAGAGTALEHNVQVVAEALDLAAEGVRGLPLRSRPAPEPGDAADPASRAELRRRVEREDAVGAEALVRGMVARGASREDWEATLYPLAADHFLDFGHALIYIGKLFELLDTVHGVGASSSHAGGVQPGGGRGADVRADLEDSVLGAVVFGIVNGTREDTLPPWAGFRKRAAGITDRAWLSAASTGGASVPAAEGLAAGGRGPGAPPELVAAIAFGTPGACFDAVAGALGAGRWTDAVDALSLAACERLLRFDRAHDTDPTVEEAWLDVTHRLTVANAVRRAVARASASGPAGPSAWRAGPDLARMVLMAAHFVNLGKALDLPAVPGQPSPPGGAADLPRALHDRCPDDAAASISSADDVATMQAFVLEDHAVRPIFHAHQVKTLVAAAEESMALGGDLTPLRAVARFLASPLQERLVRRFAHQAVRLIRDGKPPRGLTA